MNKKELVDALATNKSLAHLSKRDLEYGLNAFLDNVKKAVKKGEEVALVGFGTFVKVKRKARTGFNPLTGEKIKIKAKNAVKFRVGKAFKEML